MRCCRILVNVYFSHGYRGMTYSAMSGMVALIRPAAHVGPVSRPAICALLGRHTGWRAAVIKLLCSKFPLAAIFEVVSRTMSSVFVIRRSGG